MGRPKYYPTGKPYVLEGELRLRAGSWRELDRAATHAEAIDLFESAFGAHQNCCNFRVLHLRQVVVDTSGPRCGGE